VFISDHKVEGSIAHNTHTCTDTQTETEALHASSEITTCERQQPHYYKEGADC